MDSSSTLVEDANELVNGAPTLDDGVMERTAVRDSAVGLRAEGVPEELVVEVTATVEADCLRKSDGFLDLSCRVSLSLLLEQVVEVVDVCAMVLAVMEVKQVA